jgi:hypothetical protein
MARLLRGHLLLLVIAALAVAAVAGVFVFKDRGGTPASTPAAATTPAPQPSASSSSVASTTTPLDGTWHVGSTSTVGYRVAVTAFGLPTTVTAHTLRVWGVVTVANGSVTRCSLTVDMTSYSGTQRERDAIGAGTYPTARFVLTKPFALNSTDSAGGVSASSYPATGKLVLRGRSLPLTLSLSCVRDGSAFTVRARVPIAFARWHVPVPAGFTCRGTVEIVLHLVRGAGNGGTVAS